MYARPQVTRTNTDDEEVTDVFFVLTMRGKDQMLEGMMASMFPDKFRGDHYTISKELVSDALEHAIKYQASACPGHRGLPGSSIHVCMQTSAVQRRWALTNRHLMARCLPHVHSQCLMFYTVWS
jgi:hypothetical protein